IPLIILKFERERVIEELGFNHIDLTDVYFPVYTFQYVSAGGNSSSRCDIKMDVSNLDRFIAYLSNLVKFRNSVAGQRALMTSALREKIKNRDNFTCKICSLSTSQEKNLLLEIDHIIPLSKGGITAEVNLQTLCWKCNRSKGAKLFSNNGQQKSA
ncbi:MAG: HNH endonuclease signature motif containing protein, partial [Burkholderiales bacterium]|nr:HNH endonuclease signature motif containing protein [Burkholderiales bacterium]